MGGREESYAVHSDFAAEKQPVFVSAPFGEYELLSQAPQRGGGAEISGAVGPGRPGGTEYSYRAEYAPGGPYHKERLMRKERNPARPAVTRLCGICYGIKQKERLSGEAADKPGLGIITGMWSSVGMC